MMNRSEEKKRKVLIVGGGAGGLCAALELAQIGIPVILIEKSPFVGGILNQLDLQFPNDHCGICRMLPMLNRNDGSQFCVRRGVFHKNMSVMTQTSVKSVSGTPGRFTAALERVFPGVDPERCTGCGACISACGLETPDFFNGGLTARKAIGNPMPYAVPGVPVIDWEKCTSCGECVKACAENAIDLQPKNEIFEIEGVSGVIDARGVELTDPGQFDVYGFGVLKNVVTALSFERMLSSAGPYEGKPVRPSDGKPIKKIAWVQCVGSRNIMANADFCSSACCMFALKEAMMAKKKIGRDTDTAIFYMDLRTFGRDFQQYRDEAEKIHNVRLIRCRLHSIEPGENPGDLKVSYVDGKGLLVEEDFDLVVLSTGQKAVQSDFLEMLGLPSGEGIETLGSAEGLKDISATIISANKAASRMAAAILSDTKALFPGTSSEESPMEKGFQERPRIGVAVCLARETNNAGQNPYELRTLPLNASIGFFPNDPVKDNWEQVSEFVRDNQLNRLVVASEKPYPLWPQTGSLFTRCGLSVSQVEFVDFHLLMDKNGDAAAKTRIARKAVEMAVNRLLSRKAVSGGSVDIQKSALVLGGGPAGLSAAQSLAACGIDVTLIEKAAEIGGNRKHITDSRLQVKIDALIQSVENDSRIRIMKNGQWESMSGTAGDFRSVIGFSSGEKTILRHGAMITATGGKIAPVESYEYGRHRNILTQFELEDRWSGGGEKIDSLKTVVMIQCAGSREEPRNYCSRICCTKAVQNAVRIKESAPETMVYILYRDMMTYGEKEKDYTRARRMGVLFIPFDLPEKPKVAIVEDRPVVEIYDPVLNEKLSLIPDLLVLSSGVEPNPVDGPAKQGVCEQTANGFLQEADSKWRPVDSGREGIFICGLARNPVNAEEAMDEGAAAAQRAMRILLQERIKPQRIAARVRNAICSGCELCVSACAYGARYFNAETQQIAVDPISCQGCGACAAVCPNSATVLGDFEDNGIMGAIEAALD